ncbi:hypothetical protein NDU88_007489 [Pleurodeles waltl]|uniref:Uncharacterized protein n=1 Tax=Pleurodeles waltl TaxID=8319 RepID=A0AAV7SSW9_PLEWA|nr:hypothetical protein NDU88_007489 [Pleurodeles waltl]
MRGKGPISRCTPPRCSNSCAPQGTGAVLTGLARAGYRPAAYPSTAAGPGASNSICGLPAGPLTPASQRSSTAAGAYDGSARHPWPPPSQDRCSLHPGSDIQVRVAPPQSCAPHSCA